MRLYVNENEIDTLKRALTTQMDMRNVSREEWDKLNALHERVELCEKLQHNVKRAGGSEK